MDLKKVKDSVSIVMVGSFNPKIFHPSWFATKKLIQDAEAENANVKVVTEDVASFDLKWLQLTVVRDRFSAIADNESFFASTRDFVEGVFRLLEHTPIKQLGLNRSLCFKMESEEKWHLVGDTLAPKNLWNKYLVKPGMRSISLVGQRNDGCDGEINVTVKPMPGTRDSVEVTVNSHFELGDKANASDAVSIIGDKWDSSLTLASEMAHGLIQDCLETNK